MANETESCEFKKDMDKIMKKYPNVFYFTVAVMVVLVVTMVVLCGCTCCCMVCSCCISCNKRPEHEGKHSPHKENVQPAGEVAASHSKAREQQPKMGEHKAPA